MARASSGWVRLTSLPTLAVVAMMVIALPLLAAWRTSMAVGTAAEWVAALATLAAFLAAVVAARSAARTFTLELNRDADRDRDRRAAQAVRVGAWITGGSDGGVHWVSGLVTETFGPGGDVIRIQEPVPVVPEKIAVTYQNASALQVERFRVEIYFRAPGGSDPWMFGGGARRGVVPPNTMEQFQIEDRDLQQRMRQTLTLIPGSQSAPSDVAIGWSFVDSAGISWRRLPGEGPREDDREEPA
jgi:hypothetical protein